MNMNGTKEWQLTLYSDGFSSSEPSNTDVGIQLALRSNSATSVIGTYVMDAATIGQLGNISTAIYAIGISQAASKICTPEQLHLTISEGENGTLHVAYYMVVDGEVLQEECSVMPTWLLR
jgi:hypothetical protein